MRTSNSLEAPPLAPPARPPAADLQLSLLLVGVYIALVVGGFYFFRRGGATIAGSELSIHRSLFTTANALSLTGFQQTISIDSYTSRGQLAILVLTLAGSMISMIVGALAVARLLRMRHSISRIVWAALIVQVGALLAGTAATTTPQRTFLSDVLLAASAFGNSGVVINPPGGIFDWTTHAVLLPLAVLGGLGLPVLIDLYDRFVNRRELSSHSRVVLSSSAAVYLCGLALLVALQWPQLKDGKTPQWTDVRPVLLSSSVAALNSRTCGLPSEYVGGWSRAAQWIVVMLMFIGAGSAGTAGGLKVTTLTELTRGGFRLLRGQLPGRMLGVALAWFATFATLNIVTMTMLLRTEVALPGDRSLFISVSAASNAGLSIDPISITGDGLILLSITMLLGRTLPWVVLWCAALWVREADVAVG